MGFCALICFLLLLMLPLLEERGRPAPSESLQHTSSSESQRVSFIC